MLKSILLLLFFSMSSLTPIVQAKTSDGLGWEEAALKRLAEDQKNLVNYEYENSFLKHQLTQKQYENIFGTVYDHLDSDRKRKGHVGRTITIDTRNNEACQRISKGLVKVDKSYAIKDICQTDKENPYVSITFFEKEETDLKLYLKKGAMPQDYTSLSRREKLLKQTRNYSVLGLGMLGLVYALPEDVSHWDKKEMREKGLRLWKENVKAGPVIDKDHWVINFVGHPISGATYHVVARHAGYDRWEAFGYSVFMSTVFWEYGLEAYPETPSIQDLIFTPVIGSLLGELLLKLEDKLERQDGVLFGSEVMGSIASVLVNPAAPLLNKINDVLDSDVISSMDSYIYAGNRYIGGFGTNSGVFVEKEIGIGIEIKY